MSIVITTVGFAGVSGANERLLEMAKKELGSVSRMLPSDTEYGVKFTKGTEKHSAHFKCEITVRYKKRLIRGCGEGGIIDKALKESVTDLKRKIRKLKGKIESTQNTKNSQYTEDESNEDCDKFEGITKAKSFNISCMSCSEAIEQCELLGHSFFIFLNEYGETCVIYKRDKGYGLIKVKNN